MTRLTWSKPQDRQYETGLDRGVLYLPDGTFAAWNGLTSVDEGGGDAAEAYYLDGRPYIHLPKIKEFSATLKAYTYPDEFSAAMGLIEATDGMYLDSQMPDAFHLSYRTLVADAIQGTAMGYKIHLIYNATATPSAGSYATLQDSISPNEFSWDLQAVPVAIEGYQATAHVIIDSRHTDSSKLELIEAMLYGTGNSVPHIPTPTVLLDTLSYGDAIIVTDNGDGTFTVSGSYHNVYLIGDGIFEIDNIDAVDNGDGTYTISSTNV